MGNQDNGLNSDYASHRVRRGVKRHFEEEVTLLKNTETEDKEYDVKKVKNNQINEKTSFSEKENIVNRPISYIDTLLQPLFRSGTNQDAHGEMNHEGEWKDKSEDAESDMNKRSRKNKTTPRPSTNSYSSNTDISKEGTSNIENVGENQTLQSNPFTVHTEIEKLNGDMEEYSGVLKNMKNRLNKLLYG